MSIDYGGKQPAITSVNMTRNCNGTLQFDFYGYFGRYAQGVTNYDLEIEARVSGGSTYTTTQNKNGSGTPTSFTGYTTLPLGTSADIYARILTNYGVNSDYFLVQLAVTRYEAPGVATSISASAGNAEATISWAAPSSWGGASYRLYTIFYNTSNDINTATSATPSGLSSSTTSYTVTGLSNGTTYYFWVLTVNSHLSDFTELCSTVPSAVSATPVAPPYFPPFFPPFFPPYFPPFFPPFFPPGFK